MKVVLVHDYIKEYGGAERVLEALHEIYPKAPVFTTVFLPKFLGPHRERFKNWDIRTSWLQLIPFKEKLISIFRIITPLIFLRWDFSKYDVVIVSATGAYSPNTLRLRSGQVHVCYCHTPPRYLYGYPTAREWKKVWLVKVVGELINHFLRIVDYRSSQNVDYFIANSKNVKARIKKFYRRDAIVIYPPITLGAFTRQRKFSSQQLSRDKVQPLHKGRAARQGADSENFVSSQRQYFLTGGRLARPKRIDLAIAACTKLKLPLKIFGKEFAGYGEELKNIAGPTIEFLGEVTEEEKWELMRGARAFIFPSMEEDFGIIPVEAMSVGTPVIALKSGGVVESVIDPSRSSGQEATGIFFDKPTVDALINTLRQFDRLRFDSKAIIKHAQKFEKNQFEKKIKSYILKVYAKNH